MDSSEQGKGSTYGIISANRKKKTPQVVELRFSAPSGLTEEAGEP